MKRIIIKRSCLNLKMLFVVGINFFILLESMIEMGYFHFNNISANRIDMLSMYTTPFAFSSFVIFAGLFPGLPYAYSYLEEKSSGYLNFIYHRIERKKYVKEKIIFSGISGGLSLLIPGLCIFIIIDYLSCDTTLQQHPAVFEELIWRPYIYIFGGRLVLAFKGLLLFLFGMMWSELALLYSIIFNNKYVAYVLPFLTYELIWIIFPGTVWNPFYLVRSDFSNTVWVGVPFIIDVLYILILLFLNMRLMCKRN